MRHDRRKAFGISVVDGGNGIGTLQGFIRGGKPEGPVALLPFRRTAGFNDRIGKVEPVGKRRADPVRRLVIEMIGQEQIRPIA